MLKTLTVGRQALVITVGLPYSGKSEWCIAESRHARAPIVCPDSLRVALHGRRFDEHLEPLVWLMARTAVKAHFLSGHATVIVDATNVTRQRRDDWRRYLKMDNVAVEFVDFLKEHPKEVCLERAQRNHDTVIVPVIERMAAQAEPLANDEPVYGYC